MPVSPRLAAPLLCTLAGFGLGVLSWNIHPAATAQAPPPAGEAADAAAPEKESIDISTDDAEAIKNANEAVAVAESKMVQAGRYTPAIRTVNAYAVLRGGYDVIAALEEGRGVDPVTFAGLYQGDGVDAVLPHLGRDTLGRLTYKGNLVRMIPVERMKELDAQRDAILDVAAGRVGAGG